MLSIYCIHSMQLQSIDDKIKYFLEKKFRYSKSFDTMDCYKTALNKFQEFLRVENNLDLNQMLIQFENKTLDPIEILDRFYSFLSNYKKKGYASRTICLYVIATKEFLNSQNLHIYNEDIKQKFRLPKKSPAYEEGLTKEILVRLLHNSPPKLQTAILVCASSGMRIEELVQLRISDIDFDTNPTSICIRAETTKTREQRFTHITTEAAKSLKDYLRKIQGWTENSSKDRYLFLPNEKVDPLRHHKNVHCAKSSLHQMLKRVIKSVPELAMKNPNSRNMIHFHAFRSWFKTQVTDAHQSDFAEALLGHKSIKLVYYKQNNKNRLKTYSDVESALTVSDFTRVEATMEDLKTELASVKADLEMQKQRIERAVKYSAK
jgi:integrase